MSLQRFPQSQEYHQFADTRPLLGIPNALNVLSNLPFLLAGIFGLYQLMVSHISFVTKEERWIYYVLFFFISLYMFWICLLSLGTK